MGERYDPFAVWNNMFELGMVMAEAQAVIAMRVLGMVGAWPVPKSENRRMVSEKVHAVTKGITDASYAALRGSSPEAITAAALKPVRRATRGNARRLSRRGTGKR